MKDSYRLTVISGKGGNGCISFRRERYIPRGGPDGGDGGNGGGIEFRAVDGILDLSQLARDRVLRGGTGGNGGGQKRHGKDCLPTVVPVPLGTVVWLRKDTGEESLEELLGNGQVITVARGGHGGRGNTRFATATNKLPLLAEEGEAGEEREVSVELRVLADVGLIGLPNTGKSLLLCRVSQATPEVADYPYTTRQPGMATVERGWEKMVLVELPGIAAGAHEGKGLGNAFLRHLWRPRVLLHLVDGSVGDPVEALQEVIAEVQAYNPAFLEKPQVVVVNKVDLPHVRERLPMLRKQLAAFGVARHFISALTGQGVEELMGYVQELLRQLPPLAEAQPSAAAPRRVHKTPFVQPVVSQERDVFVVSSKPAERLVRLPDLRRFLVRLQLRQELAKLGVVKALEEAGVQPGDRVRIGAVEFLWE